MNIDNPFEDGNIENQKKFSTFRGVFRPTFLTILGVMIFLREGWVVGNAGLIGAIIVILMAYSITGLTALSIASISTNVRIRSGGAFSLVSQSLGLEMGGAIGIPFFLAQGLSGALYLRGLAEGWLLFFPDHNINYVLGIFWGLVFFISLVSIKFVFTIQSITLYLVIISVFCLLINPVDGVSFENVRLWGDFTDGNIWHLFSVFFPAATGVMVGLSMSGQLKNSRYSIPVGTLQAWGLTLFIYILAAVSYSLKAPSIYLISDQAIGLSGGLLGTIATGGLLVSCFSATLSSFAAAPQVLQALGNYNILSSKLGFQKKNTKGEPTRALYFTAFLILTTIYLADLNAIAQLLTIFFLLTYFIVNLVLLIEKKIDMISFRPELSIPWVWPFFASLLCLVGILVISPIFCITALTFVFFLYFYLTTKKLKAPWETVNSGLLLGMVNWATKKLHRYSQSSVRAWKPDMLIPINKMEEIDDARDLLQGLIGRRGSVSFLLFNKKKDNDENFEELESLCNNWQEKGLFATYFRIEAPSFYYGLRSCLAFYNSDVLHSDVIFTNVKSRTEDEIQIMFSAAQEYSAGAFFFCPNKRTPQEEVINLWIRDQSPNWKLSLESTNLDCEILLSYLLQETWGVKVRLITIVEDKANKKIAEQYLNLLLSFARISKHTQIIVVEGNFNEYINEAPMAKFNLFGLGTFISKDFMENLTERLDTPCLFIKESGKESALA